MSFNKTVKERASICSKRICCICKKFCGRNIEFHHIVQRSKGGEDTFENCIPVCFDCHSDIGHYNPRHPKGNKYSKNELIRYRDDHYKKVKGGYYDEVIYEESSEEDEEKIRKIKRELDDLEIIDDIEEDKFDIGFDSRIFNNVYIFSDFVNKRKNIPDNKIYKENVLTLKMLLEEFARWLALNSHSTSNSLIGILNEDVRYDNDIIDKEKEILELYNQIFK